MEYTSCVTQGAVSHATPSGFYCDKGHEHCLESRHKETNEAKYAQKPDLVSAHAADLFQYLINIQRHYCEKGMWHILELRIKPTKRNQTRMNRAYSTLFETPTKACEKIFGDRDLKKIHRRYYHR